MTSGGTGVLADLLRSPDGLKNRKAIALATFTCAAIREIPAATFSSHVSVRGGEFVVEPRVRGQQGY